MTRWRNHPNFAKRDQKKTQAADHEIRVCNNVRQQVRDTFRRVLADAPFLTGVEDSEGGLTIHRDTDMFDLLIIVRTPFVLVHVHRKFANSEDAYLDWKRFFGVQFPLKRMAKVRKSALLLRKKLELFDVYQVSLS